MHTIRNYKPIRLIAGDSDDLNVISACLQDAVTKVGDFAYLHERRRFAFVANRFVWEATISRRMGPFARVRAGIHFDDVLSVQQQNIKSDAKDAVVSLMAIRHESRPDERTDIVILEFSGGGSIRLEVEAVNAQIEDISEPWRTRSRPSHNDE